MQLDRSVHWPVVRCPTCGGDTKVLKTTPNRVSATITRIRECTNDARHRLTTLERRHGITLADVGIRRSGDGKLAEGVFDQERLARDIYQGALKLLNQSAAVEVASAVAVSIENRLHSLLRPLSPDEAAQRPELAGWILDRDVMSGVEDRLRDRKTRIAHVLYALSIRGRADRPGRRGWSSAADLLEWLFEESNYPDLKQPITVAARAAVDVWWPPGEATGPRMVIKRAGHARPFSRAQFEASIRKALLGRPGASVNASLVAEWVLWGIAGQSTVHSTQLSVGVLDCLHSVDDIAYLRWAAVAKSLGTVTQLRDEAQELLGSPRRRLVFDVQASPRRPDARLGPGGSIGAATLPTVPLWSIAEARSTQAT